MTAAQPTGSSSRSSRAAKSGRSARAADGAKSPKSGRRAARSSGPGRAAATAEVVDAGTVVVDEPAVEEPAGDEAAADEAAGDPATGADTPDAPDAPRTRVPRPRAGRVGAARRRRRRGPSLRGRLTAGLLAVAVAVPVGAVAWSVPPVRKVLLESFTERPRPYAELFFTSAPSFEGATVIVPLAVTDHGEGAKGYQIKVTLESAAGAAVATTTVKLDAHFGAPVPVVAKLQAPADVALLRVALVGHPQTLHYRFGNAQIPKP